MKNSILSLIVSGMVFSILLLTGCNGKKECPECNEQPNACSLKTKYNETESANLSRSEEPCELKQVEKLECNCDPECEKENAVCCNEMMFKPLSVAEFIVYSEEYRDKDWPFTSPDVISNTSQQSGNMKADTVFRASRKDPTRTNAEYYKKQNLDSRFVDISIEEMENYICQVKNSKHYIEQSINTLRFHYIRYDDATSMLKRSPDLDTTYHDRHSLAMLPASVCKDGRTNFELLIDSTTAGGSTFSYTYAFGQKRSTGQNHNTICPPGTDCPKNTWLEKLD